MTLFSFSGNTSQHNFSLMYLTHDSAILPSSFNNQRGFLTKGFLFRTITLTEKTGQRKYMKQDLWSHWLLQGRFSTFSQEEELEKRILFPIRDTLLSLAAIRQDDIVLDIGCGNGLIAFGALEKIGKQGKIIFSDISSPLLEYCQTLAHSRQVQKHCEFLKAPAEDLSALADNTVTVVTLRSVLIYVQDKQRVFSEIYRVLRPGGRFVMFEPIVNFTTLGNHSFPNSFFGYDVTPVKSLAQKVQAVFSAIEPWGTGTATSFDGRDMFTFAQKAGFATIKINTIMEFYSHIEISAWEQFLYIQPDPRFPTIQAAMQQALTASERERFSTYLRPLVEAGQGIFQDSWLYLLATKG
jgi:arsenite methyltransferase